MMNSSGYLKYCLQEVEKKLNWKKSILWKDPDYSKLSNVIYKESNITISTNTLKRLYGKIKYSNAYNPQKGTKDALTKYLGYENWDDFVSQYKHPEEELNLEIDNIPKFDKNKINFKKKLYKSLFFAVLILILFIIYTSLYSNKKNINSASYKFELKDSISQVPYTVSINYDIQQINSDSTYVDFNYVKHYVGAQYIKLNKLKHVHNFTYQIPGYYQIDLIIDNELIEQKNVLAMSEGWDSYILPENHRQEGYWLDNRIETTNKNGFLYFSPEELKSKGFDTNTVFYVANRLFKKFKIDGDNFEMDIKFKNSKDIGGITCYDFNLRLFCENETNYLKFMEEGCERFSGLKMGETILDGVDEDLSSFKINTLNWNNLNILVENKNVKITINNKIIFTGSYTTPNGMLVGIENIFKGSGMLDYIKIRDLKTQKLFFDDFNNQNLEN